MKTPTELAVERAQAIVRDRDDRGEPLTWQEIEALIDFAYGEAAEMCTCGCTGECAA